MLNFFRARRRRPLLGLDIGSTAVKAVCFELHSHKEISLHSLAMVALPDNVVSEHELRDTNAVVAALQQLRAQLPTALNDAVIAVGGSAVMTQTVAVPAQLKSRQLAAHMARVTDNVVPFPRSDIEMDYGWSASLRPDAAQRTALLAAVHRQQVEWRTQVLTAAGFRVRIMDVQCFALAQLGRWLTAGTAAAKPPVIVIDIGATMLTYCLLQAGTVIDGGDQPLPVSFSLAIWLNNYLQQRQLTTLSAAYLTGGWPLANTLPTDAVPYPVITLDPLAYCAHQASFTPDYLAAAPRFAVAAGLALRQREPWQC